MLKNKEFYNTIRNVVDVDSNMNVSNNYYHSNNNYYYDNQNINKENRKIENNNNNKKIEKRMKIPSSIYTLSFNPSHSLLFAGLFILVLFIDFITILIIKRRRGVFCFIERSLLFFVVEKNFHLFR
jgi:ATP-dependent Zn protease